MSPTATRRYKARTVFVSDVHLGYRGCQSAYFLDFLRHVETEQLVLVGDVVDLWSLERTIYWPAEHHEALREIARLARSGTRVIYVPGNHDEACREFCGSVIAGIEVRREFVHEAADGRRYLVLHGDEFDGAVQFDPALKRFGGWLYGGLLQLGRGVQWLRRRLGYGHWSLVSWLKLKVRDAREYIDRFERAAAQEAKRRGLHGVICGHIHRPGIRELDGIVYCNDGDWVEHCTALVEDGSGRFGVLCWADRMDAVRPAPAPRAALDPRGLSVAAARERQG
ncbi:MAG: UDP-2,3-diacylglucosamine diphosphatase [Steroidobacteraceae bacterium]|jgi:UDP-2,3-diacylglucosamine pyrophosphatase LpxH|nr:UDP-2,3-diacylglucosamine diphosphatase [Steroidobacteraceae bacterium]